MSDDDLLERALLDELSPGEEEALAARLRAEPALARRMVELAHDEAVLAEWAAGRGARAAPSPRRFPVRPLGVAAAVLAAGILGSLAWLLWSRVGSFTVSVEGDVSVLGDTIACGPGGRAVLRYSDGTTVEAREKTRLSSGPRDVRLLEGSAELEVAPGRFRVTTPHAAVEVVGTRFEVLVGKSSTQVVVREGRVDVSDSKGSALETVAAGHAATIRPFRPILVVPLRGSGLLGEYYDAPDLTHPVLSRTDAAIDFDWGQGPPDPSVKTDGFSVRWSGRLLPRFSEPTTFTTDTDDGARLWVDGKLLVDRFGPQTRTPHSATIELEAWRPVEFRMEYLDSEGPALARLFWSSPSTPRQVVPAEAFSLPPSGGTGLKGEYFGTEALSDLRLVRVDPVVDFSWGLSAPDPSMPRERFSIRWTGQIEAERTETVTFSTVSDDGVRLRVDGQILIDDWAVRGTAERTGRIDLVAGKRYDLKLEYLQCVSTARVRLLWGSASQPQQVIPRERLFPAP